MMQADELCTLAVGDVIETGWLLEGLAPDEPVCFLLKRIDEERELYTFELFYFDIPIGEWCAKIQTAGVDTGTGQAYEDVIWAQNTRKPNGKGKKSGAYRGPLDESWKKK